MSDFFELDFLDIESKKSGDAIPIRYELNGTTWIHLVDGGYQACGEKVINHIRTYYTNQSYIDKVIVTHPDGDHTGGLRTVLKEIDVKELWMLRPWTYAEEIISRFVNYTSVERLRQRLKAVYPNLAALEEIAIERGIPIYEPFQGARIGAFTVLAPTKSRYLDLIVESERTPESVEEAEESSVAALGRFVERVAAKAVNFLRSAWGEEVFSTDETSAENEMSVIQYANLCGQRILLTGDAGRAALTEAADYAPYVGLYLPGLDRFQVPHHGSRRNVSTEILDRWLGERIPARLLHGQEKFHAIISSAKEDTDHPRKAVVRALYHRGGNVVATEGVDLRNSYNAPLRANWGPVQPLDYPEEQEE
jgi:beta-lactamase superfamily II metal-dependent hydrolase